MWGPILEKGWAKVKGDYESAEGGYNVSGLRTIVGAPVFLYKTDKIGSVNGLSVTGVFDLLTQTNTAKYPASFATAGTNDSGRNACGIAESHAYSILEVFKMTDSSNVEHKMLMMRNPWGIGYYTGLWN